MDLAASEFGKLFQGLPGVLVCGGTGGQGNEDLVGVKPGISAAKILDLQFLDRRDGFGRDEIQVMVDASQFLDGV